MNLLGKLYVTITCMYAPMRRCQWSRSIRGRAKDLAGEADAEQGHGQVALGQLPGHDNAAGELVVGVAANVKPGMWRFTKGSRGIQDHGALGKDR